MVELNLAARELITIYLRPKMASIVLGIAESCYRGVEEWSDPAARKAAAIRGVLERGQVLVLKNVPELQKKIESIIRENRKEFFLKSDESGTRYDQLTVDVRRLVAPPSDQRDKEET